MGSHHKRNEGMKPIRRTAAKPKPEKKYHEAVLDPRSQAVLALQQVFLNTVGDHFSSLIDGPDFEKKLQGIKGYFFHRQYDKVFHDSDLCAVYAVRYLPSRALAYAELFQQPVILDLLYPPPPLRRPSQAKPEKRTSRTKMVGVGAGVGSELCALHLLPDIKRLDFDSDDEDFLDVLDDGIDLEIIDSADYEDFLPSLEEALIKQDDDDMARSKVTYTYHKRNILEWASSEDFTKILADTTLLTFMFVFNELFASSKSLTMQLIASIAQHLPIGGHVLLIESAGDLSQVKIGSTNRPDTKTKFDVETEEENERQALMVYKFWDYLPGFERILSEDRKWFRVNKALSYPLELENVGYFVRLYRKAR